MPITDNPPFFIIKEQAAAYLSFERSDSAQELQHELKSRITLEKNKLIIIQSHLEQPKQFSEEELREIFKAIPAHISKLSLVGWNLGTDCARALEVLAQRTHLSVLTLNGTKLSNEGAMALAKSPTRKVFVLQCDIEKEDLNALIANRNIRIYIGYKLTLGYEDDQKESNIERLMRELTKRAESERDGPIKKALTAFLAQMPKVIKSGKKLSVDHDDYYQDIDSLLNTEALLGRQCSLEKYQILAQRVQGAPSPALKILGSLMLALGIAVAAAGLIILATPLSLPIALAVTAAGVAALASGVGLFAAGRGGLSKSMDNLAQAITEDEKEHRMF